MDCRVVQKLRKFDHITEAMKDLHWLKVPGHIQFKVLVTIYQCVNGLAPSFAIYLLDINLTRRGIYNQILKENFQDHGAISHKHATV